MEEAEGMRAIPGRRSQFLFVASAAIVSTAIVTGAGCVERRYTIRTEPPGALAIVNDEEIGATPVSRSFVYYGDRKITLMADGFQTLTVVQPVKRPWYDNYITEFFSENLVPWTIRDDREFVYQMTPSLTPAEEDVTGRAEALRAQGQAPPPPRRRGILAWLGF
jgi:hypothetical protein